MHVCSSGSTYARCDALLPTAVCGGVGLCRSFNTNAITGTVPASLSGLRNLALLCAARPPARARSLRRPCAAHPRTASAVFVWAVPARAGARGSADE
jgi:hypothetical protein